MTMHALAGRLLLNGDSEGLDLSATTTHAVHLYEDDSALIGALDRLVGDALQAGDGAVICATEPHRNQLNERLRQRGLDLSAAISEDRYLAVDASELLARILHDGQPEFERFRAVLGDLIDRAAGAVGGDYSRLVVFGELVALLAASGDHASAVCLEQFWNALAQTRPFRLHCAYPLNVFANASAGDALVRICDAHTSVVPTESYTDLDDAARLRAIALLQQKALVLEAEIEARNRAQALLEQREAELTSFVEELPVALHWVGADGRILWANRAELAMLGYSPEEYIGHHIAEFHVDQDVIADILARLARQETLHEYPSRMRRKDGAIRDVLIDSNVLWREGEFHHTRCVTRDMTDRYKAEVAMARLAAIVDSSDDAIVAKTLEGTITDWNQGAERLFGYSAEEIVGRSITTIVPPERRAEVASILARLARGERITHFETERVRKDGTRIEISVTISPIYDRHGRIVGASKIARDIGERRALERQKQEFLEMVAHDLGSPLTVISGYAQLLHRRCAYDERAVTAIATQSERVRRLVADMLDLARLEAGRLELKRGPVNLSELAAECVAQMALVAEGRSLRCDLPPHPIVGEWDGDRLAQVLTNLLDNAVKYAPESDIIVRVTEGSDGAQVSVIDHGPGLEPRELARVFDHFYRSSRTATVAKGAGLGLFISKAIVEGHGGQLWAESAPGQGSTFTFTLPSNGSAH